MVLVLRQLRLEQVFQGLLKGLLWARNEEPLELGEGPLELGEGPLELTVDGPGVGRKSRPPWVPHPKTEWML